MREIQGDIWDYHTDDSWVVITTNGYIKANDEAVMGAGVAKQAAERFPDLPKKLGKRMKTEGNTVQIFPEYRIITFPVKHNWWERASFDLIYDSALDLRDIISPRASWHTPDIEGDVYIVRAGCGNGGLPWPPVREILEYWLNNHVTVVEWEPKVRKDIMEKFWSEI